MLSRIINIVTGITIGWLCLAIFDYFKKSHTLYLFEGFEKIDIKNNLALFWIRIDMSKGASFYWGLCSYDRNFKKWILPQDCRADEIMGYIILPSNQEIANLNNKINDIQIELKDYDDM